MRAAHLQLSPACRQLEALLQPAAGGLAEGWLEHEAEGPLALSRRRRGWEKICKGLLAQTPRSVELEVSVDSANAIRHPSMRDATKNLFDGLSGASARTR